jgi:DNA (cytosine-5)-methyltransferase 1
MRPPVLRLHEDELVVDSFAGGGGASLGIEMALGRSPDIAVNHDPEALAMHAANHPGTRHFCESVWDVDPRKVCKGKRVALAWFSPDCTFHSKARGSKPFRDRNAARRRRGLAWVVVRWAKAVKPRVICLENVEEFADWGPLLPDGKPCPERRGLTFRRWIAQLRNCGYAVDYRELKACDYGAPTTRKRLFLIARSDGLPIVWPEPTHGPGRITYRTAAECMDWTIPCRSIFGRKRPLAENTLKRIARGLRRYVIEAEHPFIVPVAGAAAAPSLIQTGWGERKGQAPRALDLHKPVGTLMAGGVKHALVAAFLAKHYGGHEGSGSSLQRSFDTITTIDHHALVASHLLKLRGGLADHVNTAQDHRAPAPTLTAGGTHLAEVRAFLVQYYGTSHEAQLDIPLHTITTRDRFGLVTVHGTDYVIADIGMRMLVPRELFRAQGFPDSYRIEIPFNGKPLAKTAQVRMVGNSVCPPVAAAIVRAQFASAAATASTEAA